MYDKYQYLQFALLYLLWVWYHMVSFILYISRYYWRTVLESLQWLPHCHREPHLRISSSLIELGSATSPWTWTVSSSLMLVSPPCFWKTISWLIFTRLWWTPLLPLWRNTSSSALSQHQTVFCRPLSSFIEQLLLPASISTLPLYILALIKSPLLLLNVSDSTAAARSKNSLLDIRPRGDRRAWASYVYSS